MMTIKRVHIFTHCADADGRASGAVLEYFLSHNWIDIPEIKQTDMIKIEFHPWNYGFKLDSIFIGKNDIVFIADINFDEDDFVSIIESCNGRVYLFDHHESAYDMLNKYKQYLYDGSVFNNEHCGCMHVVNFVREHIRHGVDEKYINMLDNIELFCQLIEYWDLNTRVDLPIDEPINNESIKYFIYYLDSINTNPWDPKGADFWGELFENALDDVAFKQFVKQCIDVGSVIYSAIQHRLAIECKSYFFTGIFENYTFIAANKYPGLGNTVFDCVDMSKYDLFICFYYTKTGYWTFSINTNKDIDLIPLWNKYNKIRSGGHQRAGAIKCDYFIYDPKNKILQLKFNEEENINNNDAATQSVGD